MKKGEVKMKKISRLFVTILSAFVIMALSTSAANAAEVVNPDELGRANDFPGTIVMSLDKLDDIATESGYTVVETPKEGFVRQYEATLGDLKYSVFVDNESATTCVSNMMTKSVPGAIATWDLLGVSGNAISVDFNPMELFSVTASWDVVEEELMELGFTVNEDWFMKQYLKGDDNKGVNIVKVGSDVVVYVYDNTYGDIQEFAITDNQVPEACRFIKLANM